MHDGCHAPEENDCEPDVGWGWCGRRSGSVPNKVRERAGQNGWVSSQFEPRREKTTNGEIALSDRRQ
jgi:hypothetical protein